MSDFTFLQDPTNKNWVVLAPRRAKRPQEEGGKEPLCPFCVGGAGDKEEIDRIVSPSVILSDPPAGGEDLTSVRDSSSPSGDLRAKPQNDITGWLVRVLKNKYPFAPIHEVIIHSPDHHKNFDTLSVEHVEQILKMYQKRYLLHQKKGQVYIFHNRGEMGGESLPHPHSQLVVVPKDVEMQIPVLPPASVRDSSSRQGRTQNEMLDTNHFSLFCPQTSQWPDEVWIAPKKRGRAFGEITDEEIVDLALTLARVIQIFDLRHGHAEFPFNFYIYPGGDWYLRLMPRLKTLGGFELGTGIYINTQDPKETMAFIREHFGPPAGGPDVEKIKQEHQAQYKRTA